MNGSPTTTPQTLTDASDLDIDHTVALGEVWRSGAWAWSDAQREAYANDLDDPRTLVAVTNSVKRSKSDQDPADWLPEANVCRYISEWVAVKIRWQLSIDPAEHEALASVAADCEDTVMDPVEVVDVPTENEPASETDSPTSQPTPEPDEQEGPAPEPESSGEYLYPPEEDVNCSDTDERNFPVGPGDPHGFDGDGDGIGCQE